MVIAVTERAVLCKAQCYSYITVVYFFLYILSLLHAKLHKGNDKSDRSLRKIINVIRNPNLDECLVYGARLNRNRWYSSPLYTVITSGFSKFYD